MSLPLSTLVQYLERQPRLMATGWPALDQAIHGWPCGSVVEILSDNKYLSGLFNPLINEISTCSSWIVWVEPPALPCHPEAGRQSLVVRAGNDDGSVLWTIEQALGSAACGLVLAWPDRVRFAELRRLQLAAARGQTIGVLFRPTAAGDAPSPAALRLRIDTESDGDLSVRVLKRRGHWSVPGSIRIVR